MPRKKIEISGTDKMWKMVPNPTGRPRLYSSPVSLWNKALEYFQWVDNNPWQVKQGTSSTASRKRGGKEKDEGSSSDNSMRQTVQVLQRPYTLYGFCSYAGIYKWGDFKANYANREGFLEVINTIEGIILGQQVDGAMLHQFDSNLTARLNGIADTTKNEVSGKDGEPLIFPKLSADDMEIIRKLNETR